MARLARLLVLTLAALLAYGTELAAGRVAAGARRLARFSRIERPTVIQDKHASHLDPTSAAPRRNRFLKTVVPFLRRIRSR